MNFEFGCARKLYAGNVHPRVMFGPDDVERLRERTRTGHGRKILAAMRRKIAPTVERCLFEDAIGKDPQAADASVIRWMLSDMAMVGVLDECPDTIRAARRALAILPAACGASGDFNNAVYSIMYGCHPLAYDLLYAQLPAEEARAYSDWVVNACVRPAAAVGDAFYKNAGANTPICGTLPALLGLLAVKDDPGVPDLTAETQRLLSLLSAALHGSIHEDGYPAEDIGYGTAVAAGLAQAVEPLRRAGLYDAYADCPRYLRFGDAILHFVQPWGECLSNTGDHSDDIICRELILARLAEETRSPALLWLLGALSYGKPPSFAEAVLRVGFQVPATALALLVSDQFDKAVHPRAACIPTPFRDRERGIVSFRSGWGADDTFVVFDGSQRSPAAQGHFHSSAGHFSISALGEYFAIDTSRYNMEQNCHNVVLIDGRSGRSTDGQWAYAKHHGVLIDYQPGEFVDFAAADSSHQHDCYWARRYLGLVKGRSAPAYVWTVDDIDKADDYREFWWQLNTSPENTIAIRRDSATIKGWRRGNLMDVHWALPAPHEYPKPHTLSLAQDVATPSSYNYIPDPFERAKGVSRPAEMVHGPVYYRPRLLAKVAGWNGRFMALMIPRRKGERPARVERL